MKRKKILSGLLLYGLGCLTGVIASYSFYKFHTIPIENGGSHNYSITDYQGIDVSNHQGLIDWEKVASDKKIQFVYIKWGWRSLSGRWRCCSNLSSRLPWAARYGM